jgi:hypothetical protein
VVDAAAKALPDFSVPVDEGRRRATIVEAGKLRAGQVARPLAWASQTGFVAPDAHRQTSK